MYLYDHLVQSSFLGTAATDAWTAIYEKGKNKNFGTSKEDIEDYAAAGGAVVGTAACIEAGPVAALCAEGGAIVAGFVAGAIYSIGAAIFGGDTYADPGDTWNPVADKAIAGIVKALRIQKGEEVSAPPGGSFRNYPEWDAVAVVWAKHVNDIISSHGGPIKWFYDSPTDKDPGRIRGAAINQWVKCGGTWSVIGQVTYPPDAECKNSQGESASKYLPEAVVRATQQTMVETLSGTSAGKSSTVGTVVKVGAVAAGAGLLWYFHTPILAFLSKLVK